MTTLVLYEVEKLNTPINRKETELVSFLLILKNNLLEKLFPEGLTGEFCCTETDKL